MQTFDKETLPPYGLVTLFFSNQNEASFPASFKFLKLQNKENSFVQIVLLSNTGRDNLLKFTTDLKTVFHKLAF